MAALHLSKDEFLSQVLDYVSNPSAPKFLADKPVVVDFYANWCSPCKRLIPIFEALSEEYKGRVEFVKIDVDRELSLAQDFRIQSIPALFFLSPDGSIDHTIGGMTEAMLRAKVEELLNR